MDFTQDVLEIKNLRSLYSYYFDSRDVDALLSLFSENAICAFPESFGGDWVGKSKIRENFKEHLAGYPHDWATIHAITNHVVNVHKNAVSASGTCYLTDYIFTSKESPLFALAVYQDDYVKLDGRWVFDRLELDFKWMA